MHDDEVDEPINEVDQAMKNLPIYDQSHLFELITETPRLLTILQTLACLHPHAYLCAGVLRNTVWAYLHGQSFELKDSDIDVIYNDELETNGSVQRALQQALTKLFPQQQWDVVNQALVHTWYSQDNAKKMQPLASIEHALSLWPETATAVAVRLKLSGEFEFIAPFGLQDLFELKLRWNPALVSYATFEGRVATKQWLQQWPKLKLIDPQLNR